MFQAAEARPRGGMFEECSVTNNGYPSAFFDVFLLGLPRCGALRLLAPCPEASRSGVAWRDAAWRGVAWRGVAVRAQSGHVVAAGHSPYLCDMRI